MAASRYLLVKLHKMSPAYCVYLVFPNTPTHVGWRGVLCVAGGVLDTEHQDRLVESVAGCVLSICKL